LGLHSITEEEVAMKKHWLRGMLLGLSLALLLASGVALAQGTLKAEPRCVNCVPEQYWDLPDEEIPYGGYRMTLAGEGWTDSAKCGNFGPMQVNGAEVYHEVRWPNGEVWGWCLGLDPDGSFMFSDIMWGCGLCPDDMVPVGYEAGVSNGECVPALGELEFYVEDDTGHRSVFVLLARDCAAATFVPEPGTILLLGSGLAGLAGYGALRWRNRG